MIAIIDYGLGNIQAFVNVYKQLHTPVRIAKRSDDLAGATKLILPGVGAFDHAMSRLNESGMRQALDNMVLTQKIPVLGVCVGMQMLADASDEGVLPGLGWVKGHVKAFESASQMPGLPLPHMGWNNLSPKADCQLFYGLENEARFYFLHSFYFECQTHENSIATSSYGLKFSCAVAAGEIYGVQFHPEKSHHYGVTLLKNYSEI